MSVTRDGDISDYLKISLDGSRDNNNNNNTTTMSTNEFSLFIDRLLMYVTSDTRVTTTDASFSVIHVSLNKLNKSQIIQFLKN